MTFLPIIIACTISQSEPEFPDLPPIMREKKEVIPIKTRDIKRFSIALTGEIRGEIEPCGCPTLPYGGFERRANALEDLQKNSLYQPLFQFDAGEMLLKGFFSNKEEQKDDRAKLIATLAKDMGVDVWAIGPSDLLALELTELQQLDSPPKISATWTNEQGEWFFPPFAIVEKQGVKLGVIGLSKEPTDPELKKQITFQKPQEIIHKIIPQLPEDLDLIIGLGSIDDLQAEEIAKTIPNISLLLTTEGSHHQPPFHPYSDTENSLIIEAPKQGRFIQQIQVILGGTATEAPKTLIDEQKWRDWNLLYNQEDSPRKKELEQLFLQFSQENNLYYAELIPLNESYDKKNLVTPKIEAFAQNTIQKATKIAESETTPLEPGFASSGRCASCHQKEMAKWSFSKHARAWETMIHEKQTDNPECISCHTTGFGQKGGFGELTTSNIRKYKGVQCEACHGPMRGHPEDDSIHSQPVVEETCLVCHDEANSPNFNWKKYKRLSTCQ